MKKNKITISVPAEYLTTFTNFQQWVNKATTRIGGYGNMEQLLCLDKNGNVCHIGQDFMAARDADLFPVKAYRLIRTIETIPSPTSSGE